MRRFVFASIIAVGCLAIPAAAPIAQDRVPRGPQNGSQTAVSSMNAVTEDHGSDARTYVTWEEVFTHRDLLGVLGTAVQSNSGEDMGRIVQVLVDQPGQARAAVIDFGGFLGVGSRKVVVDWTALHFAPDVEQRKILLDLTRDQVKAAPEYKSGKPVVVLGAAMTPGPEM
jgi:hypothetical protein